MSGVEAMIGKGYIDPDALYGEGGNGHGPDAGCQGGKDFGPVRKRSGQEELING